MDVQWFMANNIILQEHDLIIRETGDYEKVSKCKQCVTCEASYCLLCGKMSNNEDECACYNID